MRLLKILIILIIVAYPFGELLRFDLGNNIRFKPLDILAGLIMISWFILLFKKKIKLPSKPWFYFAFPIVGIASLLFNIYWLDIGDLLTGSLYLFRWFSYLTIFFVLLSMHQIRKTLATLLIFDGLVIVMIGFIQFFFYSNLKPLYYLGWDDHMYRLFSVFLDPNFTGGFFVLYILFIGGLIYKLSKEKKLDVKQSLLDLPFSITYRNVRLLLISILCVSVIAMFLTFSRSTLLMFIVGASTFFILIGRKKLIFGLLSFIILFIFLISSRFYIENVNLFRQASTISRLGNYQNAFTIIKSSPLIGVGFNTYRYAKAKQNITMEWLDNPSHADAGVDNSFLFVLATTGIIGVVAYVVLWYSILKRAFVLHKNDKNIYAIIIISSTAGLFIHAIFINSLFFPAIMVWMWFMLGLMEQT